jgi:ribonucleoside-diphosphate reductase alpha chain
MEKSTSKTGALNAVSAHGPAVGAAAADSAAAPAVPTHSAPGTVQEVQEGAACYLRPGDAGFEECEACQ